MNSQEQISLIKFEDSLQILKKANDLYMTLNKTGSFVVDQEKSYNRTKRMKPRISAFSRYDNSLMPLPESIFQND